MFMDESGIHDDSPVVSVGAYIARPTKWLKFAKEWRKTLLPKGIGIFHATDCAALQGEFQGWSVEERDKLVASLLPIIPRYAFGYAVVVKVSEVKKVLESRPDLQRYAIDHYASCFQWVITSALNHLREVVSDPRPIAVVHEINDYRQTAMEAFKYIKETHPLGHLLLSLTFGTKAEFVPLQAADTLAYESARRINYQDGPERRSLKALYADGRVSLKSFNRNNIGGYIEMLQNMKEAHEEGLCQMPGAMSDDCQKRGPWVVVCCPMLVAARRRPGYNMHANFRHFRQRQKAPRPLMNQRSMSLILIMMDFHRVGRQKRLRQSVRS
jgi:hypothetical protein